MKEAKVICKENKAYSMCFLFLMASSGLSSILHLFVPNVFTAVMSGDKMLIWEAVNWGRGLGLFLSVLLFLFGTVLSFGFQRWNLKIARGESPPRAALIEGFGMTGRVLFLEVLRFMFMYFWLVCYVMAVAMCAILFLIVTGVGEEYLYYIQLVVSVAALIVLAGGALWLHLRYCFASFHLADAPEKGAWNAISSAVQRQRKCFGKLLSFHLRLFPWFLAYVGTVAFYLLLTAVLNYYSLPVVEMNFDLWMEYTTIENTLAYYLSQGVDFLFLLCFLPRYYVSLALFYQRTLDEGRVSLDGVA